MTYEIGFQVESGMRRAADVVRILQERLGDRWDDLRAYFADEYESVRVSFEDEAWVGEMTPEGQVQAAVDSEETPSPAPALEATTSMRVSWNTRYEASKPRLVQRMKAMMRITDKGELVHAEHTIAAVRNLPEVGKHGGSVRIENRVAQVPGDSDFIYSLFVSDEGFELCYHERLMMEGGQSDYTDTLTLVRCNPIHWETDEESLDEEALANMREVAEMMAEEPFDDEEWQMQVEAARELGEVNLPNGIEDWLEMLPVDNEGKCPKTVRIEWE